jgi:hypothetical protein
MSAKQNCSLPRVSHQLVDQEDAVEHLVRLVAERHFTPHEEVEREGRWWPGFQHAWLLCDDGRGWMAASRFSARYERGLGKHLSCVPPGRTCDLSSAPEVPQLPQWPR